MSGRLERLALWLLAATAAPHRRVELLGDVAEELQRQRRGGERTAQAWLWREVILSVGPNLGSRWRFERRLRRQQRQGEKSMINDLVSDLRFAGRAFTRQPAFTAVVVLTIAFGICAATVVLSVVDGVLFDPFPYPEPQRLVGIGPEYPKLGRPLGFIEVLSPAEYLDVRTQSETLERVVAWDMGNRQVSGTEAPENVFSAFWWGDPLATLEVAPAYGRSFTEAETVGEDKLAMISYRLWQRLFGADPAAVGRTMMVNGEPYQLIGVLPPRALIFGTDLWIPMGVDPARFPRARRQFQILARIKAGHGLGDVNTELEALARRTDDAYRQELPEYEGWHLEAMTWSSVNVRSLRPMAAALVGAVAFLLLLVCANVASLLLARGPRRRRELGVRRALGAGRVRVLRQLLTESVLLAGSGGVLGAAVAWAGVRGIAAAVATLGLPIPFDIEVNRRVLLLAAAVTVASGLLFGLAPALQGVRGQLEQTLRIGGHGGLGRRFRLQRALVALEVALAMVLLFGSGLLVASLLRLQRVDAGVDPTGVLTLRITLPWQRYGDREHIEDFFRSLVERMESRPEIASAALSSQIPPRIFAARKFEIEGMTSTAEGELPSAYFTAVSPELFSTLGIRLLSGRTFEPGDRRDAPGVAVLNQAAARRFFPDQDPLGKRFRIGDQPWFEIVGLVEDTRNRGTEQPTAPELYGSLDQLFTGNQLFVVVKSTIEPAALVGVVREEVRALDPEQPIYMVQTLEHAYAALLAPRRLATRMLGLLGLFALVLAGVGIYSVVSFSVSQRRSEIGLRLALGAGSERVRRWVMKESLTPVLIGGAFGLAGVFASSRMMTRLLFEVPPLDPLILSSVAGLLLAVAMGASLLPAVRATRIDPIETLRQD